MRRFAAILILTSIIGLGAEGARTASASTAHAATVIPIVVVKARGQVAVFAKIVIHGRAFPFQIDTGASVTLVDPAIARRLHLRTVGRAHKFCGVTGCSVARRVRLRHWSIGGQPLPNVVAASAPIAGTGGRAFGLLGSDVLSKFGSVTIDYRDRQLILG